MTLDWLVRAAHVLFAAIWTGGYAAVLALLLLAPRQGVSGLARVVERFARFLSYAGTAAYAFGLLLVWRTRGYGALADFGEWGMLVAGSIVLATAVLAINDSALRPALRRMAESDAPAPAARWAAVGLALLILTIALMTRALYANA